MVSVVFVTVISYLPAGKENRHHHPFGQKARIWGEMSKKGKKERMGAVETPSSVIEAGLRSIKMLKKKSPTIKTYPNPKPGILREAEEGTG